MDRRRFILAAFAFGLAATAAVPAAAIPFQPSRFSVEVRGRGPDVILIPGLTSGRDVWAGAVASVPGYRYHLVQVSGFAGDPTRGNARGAVVAPLADEIARYIVERRLVRPAIVGHSMGGTLAMMIAARRPELVGRLMVVDMYPQPASLFGGTGQGVSPLARSLGTLMESTGGRRLFTNLMAAFSPPDAIGAGSDPDVVARTVRDLSTMDLTGELGRIRAPMTVVYAVPAPEARATVDRQFARAYAAAPRARLVRIDGSGHMVMQDQPARFRAALAEFLRR